MVRSSHLEGVQGGGGGGGGKGGGGYEVQIHPIVCKLSLLRRHDV